jgi:hypothetical protein
MQVYTQLVFIMVCVQNLTIKLATWNPMHLSKSTCRAEEISRAFAEVQLMGVIGTGCKEWTDIGHHRKKLDNHVLIGFGYNNDKHSNRSAGCALLVGRPFAETHLHSIVAPSKQSGLRGRAGAVTVKYGSVMMRFILAYFPPRPWDCKQEPQWRATCKALRAWVFHQWDQAKEKETPFIMTDLNT